MLTKIFSGFLDMYARDLKAGIVPIYPAEIPSLLKGIQDASRELPRSWCRMDDGPNPDNNPPSPNTGEQSTDPRILQKIREAVQRKLRQKLQCIERLRKSGDIKVRYSFACILL